MKKVHRPNTTSNTRINKICKRDNIVAIAKADTVVGGHEVKSGQAVEGYGHWDDAKGVYLWVYKVAFEELYLDEDEGKDDSFDTMLPHELWDVFVLTRYERKKDE